LSAVAATYPLPTRPPSPLAVASGAGPRSRRRALLAFAALAALLHLALLGAIDGTTGKLRTGRDGERTVTAAPWLSVRTIAVEPPSARSGPPAAAPAAVAVEAKPDPRAGPVRVAKASARSQESRETGESAPESHRRPAAPIAVGGVAAEPSEPEPPPIPVSTAFEAVDVAEPSPDPAMLKVALDAPGAAMGSFLAAGERAPPTYRTVLPAPAILRYELRRGFLRGTGEIRWRPAGDRYALQFEARLAGLLLLAQSSQGEVGATGLAPVRFVDQRARKAARAVNFSRDSGTISFSGSSARWPLLAGTQDRLSWMIQLGGIVAADPSLAAAGRISMVLVSARGEASVRTARFAGRENAETVSGSVPALKFVVDGHSAYDGSFEIWLDPARGYLPARAVSRNSAGDAEFELLLQRADP
jgi:hypothetical protein